MLIALVTHFFSLPFEILYWIKWILSYIFIHAYKKYNKKRFDSYEPNATGDPEKLGFLIPQIEIDFESPQTEKHLEEGADEVFFYGVNSKGECFLVRVTRGLNQVSEAWIYLKLANGITYHLSEHVNYQQPFEGKCLSFSSGHLQMHYLLPMRRWRIYFCGSLKEKSEDKKSSERNAFVKFAFTWSASSDVYEMTLDTHSTGLASAVARADWETPFFPPIKEITEAVNFYSQIGNIRGTVSVDDDAEYEMHLFGEKLRSLGNSSKIAGCNFENVLGYVPENGFGVHLSKVSVPQLFKNLTIGFVIKMDGDLHAIKDLDIIIKPFSSVKKSREFQATFNTDELFELSGNMSSEPIVLYSGQGWDGFLELFFVSFTINNRTGYGLLMSGEVYSETKKISKPIEKNLFPKTVPLTVKFSDDISHFGDISGGKGSSLGKLTKLSRTDKTFTVPKGIIVTTSAYETFLNQNVLKAIEILESIVYEKSEGNVKEACDLVSNVILNTALPNKLTQNIIADLKLVFKENFRNYKYAVRSSATGEDTEAMSAAGQMETFLGVQGLQEIFLAVKKCWASQFGHIAIEYKRQNGQLLNSPMAVVIQEMVACDVAGVIFTCNPVNNNPNVITITANYGLGETVVSGSVEPDTIMIERVTNDNLQIKSVNIGSKHQKIVLKENGGTVTEDLSEDSQKNACISNETAEILAKLAIKVEKFYRSSRDIEWGISNNVIYLLQSRPVTNAAPLTDFEIKHEFDCVLRCERDYFTVANVGEVMPGATSPLGMELISKYLTSSLAHDAFNKGLVDPIAKSKYYPSAFQTFCYQVIITVPEMACRYGHDSLFSKGLMISMFGRILEEPEIYEVAKEKMPFIPPPTLWSDLIFIKDLFFYGYGLKRIRNDVFNYNFPFLKYNTAQETFDALMKSCSDFEEAFINHMHCSESSSHWNIIIFLILVKAKGRFDNDVYSDFGRILATSSNLESADVPSSMQGLANQIVKDLGPEKFKAMTVEEAEEWLKFSKTQASVKYREFLKRHGHRCLKEFDILSIPWGQDPKILIRLLQSLTGCAKEVIDKIEDGYAKIFSELRIPLNFLNKLFLRFVIPNCRTGVRTREASKSILIKSMSNWRIGYQRLAKQMVSEGRIPDAELMFFMTIEEIRDLLKTRYPKIIVRANHRRKMFPILDQYKFPEIMRGFPKPMNEEDESSEGDEYIADLTMQGIPVSQGVIKGYARVAVSLDQAALLKPGEILIAYSTDIGWSPYFPIISGVVTELGGLISHGAVVSREYGLPCVVGLKGATKQFKTGDYVLLDGKKGLLQRLPQPKEEGA